MKYRSDLSKYWLLTLPDMQLERVSTVIKSELEDLENPRVGPETGLRDFFMWHCEQFEEVLRRFNEAALKGFDTPTSLNNFVTEVDNLGHKVYFLLTYGGPLSRSGSDIQKGDGENISFQSANELGVRIIIINFKFSTAFLLDARNFGLSSLDLLALIKERKSDAVS
jgi:hypothetical protein